MVAEEPDTKVIQSQSGCLVEHAATTAARAALAAFAHRADLVDEFVRAPFGRHSPDLCFVLDVMRSQPMAGKWFAIMTKPYSEWRAARWSVDGSQVAETESSCFQSREDVERWVFKQRWKNLIGKLQETENDAY